MTCTIISHRGLCKIIPTDERKGENTIEAFDAGIEVLRDEGFPLAIECDIRRSKDDELIILHDHTVDRTTNGHGRACDCTLTELKKLDAGYGRTIPTLHELLLHFQHSNVLMHLELKENNLATRVYNMVTSLELHNQVVLSAFDSDEEAEDGEDMNGVSSWDDLRTIPDTLPFAFAITHKKMNDRGIDSLIKTAAHAGAVAIHPEGSAISEELVTKAHDAHLRVHAWTINDAHTYETFARMGVDGVFCDNPRFLI